MLAGCEWDDSEKERFDNENRKLSQKGKIKKFAEMMAKRVNNKIRLVQTLQSLEKNDIIIGKFHKILSDMPRKENKSEELTPDEQLFVYLGLLHHIKPDSYGQALQNLEKVSEDTIAADITRVMAKKKWDDFNCSNPRSLHLRVRSC